MTTLFCVDAFRRTVSTVPVEGRALVRVDRERDRHAGPDLADLRFVHASIDLQLTQVGREHEELCDVHARLHGLADVHLPVDDDAVDRRADDRVAQVELGLVQVRFRRLERLLRRRRADVGGS